MRHTSSCYVYENRSDGHFKDYKIEVDYPLLTVHVSWGRISGAKQHRTFVFSSSSELDAFVLDAVTRRHAHGYKQVFNEHTHDESRDFSLDILEMTAV